MQRRTNLTRDRGQPSFLHLSSSAPPLFLKQTNFLGPSNAPPPVVVFIAATSTSFLPQFYVPNLPKVHFLAAAAKPNLALLPVCIPIVIIRIFLFTAFSPYRNSLTSRCHDCWHHHHCGQRGHCSRFQGCPLTIAVIAPVVVHPSSTSCWKLSNHLFG